MLQRINVKGNRIHNQMITYQVNADRNISEEEIQRIEEMKESEFLAYATEHNIRYVRVNG